MSQDLSNVVELFPGCMNPEQKKLMDRLICVHFNFIGNFEMYIKHVPDLVNLPRLQQKVMAHYLYMKETNKLLEGALEIIETTEALDELFFEEVGLDKVFEQAKREGIEAQISHRQANGGQAAELFNLDDFKTFE